MQKSTNPNSQLIVSGTMIQAKKVTNTPKPAVKKIQNTKLNQPIKQKPKPQLQIQPPQPVTESIKQPIQQPDSPKQQFVIQQSSIPKYEDSTPVYRQSIQGDVVVKYSHYKEKFPITDDLLKESIIDEQYCLSYVFKGNFVFQLRKENDPTRTFLPKHGAGWRDIEDQQTYILEVEEDPAQLELELRIAKKYQPFDPRDLEPKVNGRVDLITQQLKGMSIEEIQSKGDKYKELIEARDLEDILYK